MNSLVLKITPQYVCGYMVDGLKIRSKLQEISCLQNFEKAYKVGKLSDGAARKIKDKLTIWLLGINYTKADANQKGLTVPQYPTFVTLTLSKEQTHDDEYIKRELLSRYIETLKKKYGVINYYWRAEKKVGKRIHFHLIIDKFVFWKDIRKEWNLQQFKNGYHDSFNFNSNDMGHNSTDIDKVNGAEQLVHYISDYVAKNEDNAPIEGRVWGCSSALHSIDNCAVLATPEIQRDYVKLLNAPMVNKRRENMYTLCTWKKSLSLNIVSYGLFKIYRDYCQGVYRNLYAHQSNHYTCPPLQRGLPTIGVRQVIPKITYEDKMQFQYSMLNDMFAEEKMVEKMMVFDPSI
jgi:hypothetical protein